jgi:hypothetical protein
MITQRALNCWVLVLALLPSCSADAERAREGEQSGGVEAGAAGQPASAPAESVWCDAFQVIVAKCGRCHGEPPTHGAPFSVISYAELGEVDAKGVSRRERMAQAIERGDMPAQFITLEPPVESLSDDERELLLQGLRETELPDPSACD